MRRLRPHWAAGARGGRLVARRAWVWCVVTVGLLGVAGSASGTGTVAGSGSGSAHARANRARTVAHRRGARRHQPPVHCHGTTYEHTPYVECVVTSSGHVAFPGGVPVLVGNLSSNIPVTITAIGGKGGGTTYGSADNYDPGAEGSARTVVNYGELEHGGLHAYVGQSGNTSSRMFLGGASTMALSESLHHGLTLGHVYLDAGGGGAQGRFYSDAWASCGAGSGGHGKRADASHSHTPVSAPGGDGGKGKGHTPGFCTKTGEPGRGGGNGIGGVNPEGGGHHDGSDGIGGRGGSNPWIGAQGGVAEHWNSGRGGMSNDAQGGGGWGGGAAGTRGAGAGAGGSYAAAATAKAPAHTGYRKESSVTFAWPQPRIELHPSGAHGGHGTIEYYVDHRLRETITGRHTVHIPAGYVTTLPIPQLVPSVGPAIVAKPATGSRFIGWSGAATGTEPRAVTINRTGMTFTAHFVPTHAIAAVDGPGRVTVHRADGTLLCHDVRVCEAPHHLGEKVRVTATAEPIADFSHFLGHCEQTEVNHCTGPISADRLFIAVFKVPHVTLTMRVNPYATLGNLEIGGHTVCGWSVGQWENCTVSVPKRGPLVHVRTGSAGTIPAEFSHWSGACTGTMHTCTIDPSKGSQSLTATFH